MGNYLASKIISLILDEVKKSDYGFQPYTIPNPDGTYKIIKEPGYVPKIITAPTGYASEPTNAPPGYVSNSTTAHPVYASESTTSLAGYASELTTALIGYGSHKKKEMITC